MKVAGQRHEISVDEYADLVADHVRASVRHALVDHDIGDEIAPDPADVAESVGDLMVYLPDESPNELAQRLAPFWSAAKVRRVFDGASRQMLAERRKSGTLLGLKTTDGDIVYPVFQFQRRHGQIEVKPGLLPAMRVLRGFDAWTVAVLLRSPSPELGGLTPLDWVRSGRPAEPLSTLAEAVAREWSTGAA